MSKIYKKHNSVPVKQWSNVNYSFNRNNDKYLYKNNFSKILNSYFNLTKKTKSFKSKRMRDLIKRFSTTKLFNNEGGIKQNSDKINLTVYTFDKEKSSELKTIFNLNKSLTKISKFNTYRLKSINNINNFNNRNFIPLYKKLSLKNLINAFLPKATTKEQISNKTRKNFRLTNKNNVLFNNIYIKNLYRYKNNNKSKINLLAKKANVTKSIKSRNTFYKNKRIILQKKRNLLYKKLINTLPWSFKNNKVILYKIMYLRLFYLYILNTLGITMTIKKQQNSTVLFCNSNIYKWANTKINSLPIKFTYIENVSKLYKLVNTQVKNKLISKFNLSQYLYNSKENKSKLNLISVIANNITNRKVPKLINRLKLERGIWLNNKLENMANITLNIIVNGKNNNNNNDIFNIQAINKLKKTLYKEYKSNNINLLVGYFFDKQLMIIRNMYKQFINNEKYTSLTNTLKYKLNKLYNKKVYLNLVDLKYLHLNTNNLTDAIIIKLKNKNNSTLRIIQKSMNLARLAKFENLALSEPTTNLENTNYTVINTLGNENKTKNTNFTSLINEMYNLSLVSKMTDNSIIDAKKDTINIEKNNKMFKNKTKEIFKNLKHKWITGVKLETKGRLTKRFASSRSVFKYRAKGNLRTRENSNNEDVLKLIREGNKVYKESPSVILSRGINIPSIDYVRKSGSRRIGSFGIKLWINNN